MDGAARRSDGSPAGAARRRRRTRRPRRPLLAVLPAVLLALVLAACGADDDGEGDGGVSDAPPSDQGGDAPPSDQGGDAPPSDQGGERARSVAEALEARGDGVVLVRGGLFVAPDGTMRLCDALLESYPPQCGEPSVLVEGLDPATVEGLVSDQGRSWSEAPVEVRGVLADRVLTVDAGGA